MKYQEQENRYSCSKLIIKKKIPFRTVSVYQNASHTNILISNTVNIFGVLLQRTEQWCKETTELGTISNHPKARAMFIKHLWLQRQDTL